MRDATPTLIGRQSEIDTLERVVDAGVPLVSVVGPLGAGKTRLATELCLRRGASALFVELEDVTDYDTLVRRVSAAVGASLEGGEPVDALATAMRRGPHDVVVLDNVEQVIDDTRVLVEGLRRHRDLPVLVATSREALELPAEVCIALGSLPAEEAVELFAARAAEVVPGFEIAERDRATVAELLALLDNLPLVIELAAARASVLPPTQLLRRIADRFALVREAQPRRNARQASLYGAVSWSWELLTQQQRVALSRASVFRGGFGIDAAEAVFGVDDVIGTLDELVRKSLLRRQRARDAMDVRFAHYESIRAFAAEQLADDERQHAEGLFVQFYERLGARCAAPLREGGSATTQADALAMLDEELGNLWHALELGGADGVGDGIDALLEARGPARMRERAARMYETQGAAEQRRLLALAQTHVGRGELEEGASFGRAAEQIGEHPQVHLLYSRVARARGELDSAVQQADRALELSTTPSQRARALANKAAALLSSAERAQEVCQEALNQLSRTDDARLSIMVRNVAGTVAMAILDLDTATAHFQRVLDDARRLGEVRVESAALSNLALMDHYRGALRESAEKFGEAADRLDRVGLRAEGAIALANRAAVLIDRAEYVDAASDLADALATLRGRGDVSEAIVVAAQGNLYHARGDVDRACARYDEALRTLPAGSPHADAAQVYAALAQIALGNDHAAQSLLENVAGHGTWGVARDTIEAWRSGGDVVALVHGQRGLPQHVVDCLSQIGPDAPWLFARLVADVPRGVPQSDKVREPDGVHADLTIDRDGYWFVTSGGERVDIRRRGPARLLLLAMADRHAQEPGHAFDLDELFEIGWPGQAIPIDAAYKRVYAAIGTLRRLGLDDILVTTDEGYLIAPTVTVARAVDA